DLYTAMDHIDPGLKSQELYIRAKHSLESIAAREADVFTTVSNITARECRLLLEKEVDLITPNGFDLDMVPGPESFDQRREIARKRLFEVANAVLEQPVSDDSLLVGISGRYELRNKGIDLFVESLARIQVDPDFQGNILAFILIPANQHGPREE